MDDFNGKFCKNGSFPVIRSVKNCFDKESVRATITTKKMATAIAANDGARPTYSDVSLSTDEFDLGLSLTTPNDYDGVVDETNTNKNSSNKNNYLVYTNCFIILFDLFKFKNIFQLHDR
jgi:hypothetical protein